MTSPTRVVRGARRRLVGAWQAGLRRSVVMLGTTPRVAYMHYWTLREGADSLVAFHNYFSLLDPHARGPCHADLRVYDADGRTLATTGIDVPARGCAQVSVRSLLPAAVAAIQTEGSLELDVLPPGDFTHERNVAGAFEVSAARFFMLYRSPAGMLATSHCIEKSQTYRGLPSPLAGLLTTRERRVPAWRCKRPIATRGLQEVRVVVVNYAESSGRLHVALRMGAGGPVVAEARRTVPPRGLLTLEHRQGDEPAAEFYTLHSEGLPTPNGKPYLWVRYGDGPAAMHHA